MITDINLARNGNSRCANESLRCAKWHFEENPHENERIGIILGCVISFIGARIAG